MKRMLQLSDLQQKTATRLASVTFNSADIFNTHCKLRGVIFKSETIPVVRDPPVARDRPADPNLEVKFRINRALPPTSPLTFIPPPPPLRQNYPDPGRYYFGTMDIRNVLLSEDIWVSISYVMGCDGCPNRRPHYLIRVTAATTLNSTMTCI